MQAKAVWVATAATVLALAGCGDGKRKASCGSGGGSTAAKTGGRAQGKMFLTHVRAKAAACSDRVELDFRDDGKVHPSFHALYLPAGQAKIEDATGRKLEIAGSAFLVIRLFPSATADPNADHINFTYKGPNRLRPAGMRHVKEIVKTGDFEAVVTWVIGLDGKRPFKVSTSSAPPRLTIEIG